jgi:hypothetical protein
VLTDYITSVLGGSVSLAEPLDNSRIIAVGMDEEMSE